MMKKQMRSWIMPLALLGVVGCGSKEADEPGQPAPQGDHQVTAWVPGTPKPTPSHAAGAEHSLVVDWVRVDGSIEELTDHSALVINGRVESTRFDVIRAWAQSKVEGQPTGEASGIYDDLPVTIATVRIDGLARSSQELKTASGGAMAQGATVDIMFPGGLISDGCTLTPDDNPLPKVGEQAVFFLTPQAGTAPLAMRTTTGVYSVTGGPLGRILVQDGLIQGASSTRQASGLDKHVGGTVDALFDRVSARAKAAQYMGPDMVEESLLKAGHDMVSAQSSCGLALYPYKWCRKPTNIYFRDYTGPNWPISTSLPNWMYTGINNSLYLHHRMSGTGDVNVYEANYGANGWYGYANNNRTNGCITSSMIRLNTYYYTGSHYAKTVTLHEIGHILGFDHHYNCNSIMYTDPTRCAAAITTCDAQAAAERYPY